MWPDRSHSEAGFALIEVLVSATLLVVIAVSLLASVDRTTATAVQSRARSVSAQVADQDQERLRAMPFTSLATSGTDTNDVTVGSVTYHVASTAEWIDDQTGDTPSCVSTTQADYLRITSTVTTDNVVGSAIKPVTISSLVAPPATGLDPTKGSLSVKLVDRNGTALAGFPVNISGPSSKSATTNSVGCAVFPFIATGNYTIGLPSTGYVTKQNKQTATTTVNPGSLTPIEIPFDRAAKVTISYDTYVGGASVGSKGWDATAQVATSGGTPWPFDGTTPPQPSVDATSLFPWTDGYEFYAGGCVGADPGATAPTLTPAPGSTSNAVTVRQPPVTLVVKNGSSFVSGAKVVLTPTDTGCTPLTLTTDGNGRLSKSTSTTNYDPGVPFGKYKVCVSTTSPNKKWTSAASALDNKNANGTNLVSGTAATTGILDLNSVSTTTGTC
jgi:Tfp pilus assembly protein PilV